VILLHGTIAIGALLNYQGGYKVLNAYAEQMASAGVLPEQNIVGSPLWKQARAVAYSEYLGNDASGFFEDGTVLRVQEVSLTAALPPRWARAAHVRSLSLTAAVRNLTYWTRYSGGDPAASDVGALQAEPSANTNSLNNDVRSGDANAIPLARYYQFRLNVGF
jgi:hypothetical protein